MAFTVALSLLAAGRSRAQDVADEADFHFRRGESLIQAHKYEEALSALYAAQRLVPENVATSLNIALCLEALKRFDEAFRVQAELAALSTLSDAQRKKINDAIARLKPRVALIRVESRPPGAPIFLGRRDLGSVGTTPKTLAVHAGQTLVILDLDRYAPAEAKVSAATGTEVRVDVSLVRYMGDIEVIGIPPNAEVHADSAKGPVLRVGPGSVRVPSGPTNVVVTAPGFVSASVPVNVPKDGKASFEVQLAAIPVPTGTLVVHANLDGALVRLDGNDVGYTPAMLERVPVGDHTVEVQKEGRQTAVTQAHVDEGKLRTVEVKLLPEQVEITGMSKGALKVEDAAASLTVISADEIRAFGWRTLADALRTVRGFYVWDDRAHSAVGVRGVAEPGTDSNAVLVMLNGHPMNDPMTGRAPIGYDLPIDLADVERIEIARGGGIIFGVVALAAVVNVVTRQPHAGVSAEVGGNIGTLDAIDGHAALGGRGRLGDVAGFAGAVDRYGQAFPGTAPGSDREQEVHAYAVAHLGDFALMAGWGQRFKALPTSAYGSLPDGKTGIIEQHGFLDGQFQHEFAGGSRLFFRLSGDQTRFAGRYDYVQGAVGDEDDGFSASAEVRWEWAISRPLRLTLDLTPYAFAVAQKVSDTSGELESGLVSARGIGLPVYAGLEWAPLSWLRLTGGIRGDLRGSITSITSADLNNPLVNPTAVIPCGTNVACYAPQVLAAMVAHPYDGGSTKLLYNAAVPSLTTRQQFHNVTTLGDPSNQLLNEPPALGFTSDYLLFGELQHTHRFSDEFTATASVFWMDHAYTVVENLDPLTGRLQYQNNGPVHIVGGDAEFKYDRGDGVWASATAGRYLYTYTGYPRPINVPQNLISFRALYPVSPFKILPVATPFVRIGLEGVYVGGLVGRGYSPASTDYTPTADEFLLNFLVSGDFQQYGIRYTLGFYNVFNDQAGAPAGWEIPTATVPQLGRSIRLDVTWQY